MKKYLLLLCIAASFVACEDVEDNSPAFQANINNEFFKTLDSRATQSDDGIMSFVGSTSDQTMTINVSVFQGVNIELNSGDDDEDQAYFEDATGKIYSTENGGSGSLSFTQRDSENQLVSGNFNFIAISEDMDTITVDRGIFFKIPYISAAIEDPTDPADPQDGTFVAEIDGELFDPSTVVATTTDTSIVINGALGDDTIQLVIPLDAEPAAQTIPAAGFNATYFIAGEEEPAVSGTIRVFAHDMTAQSISGTFNFATENHQISLGQFNLDY